MNQKQLLIMAVALLLLIVGGLVLKTRAPEASLEKQAGLVRLAPESFAPEAVGAVAFSQDGGQLVKLRKDAAGWVLESAWNAPADTEKIAKFLGVVKELKGEFVSDRAENQDQRGVDEKGGLLVEFFPAGADKPSFSLVIGKNRGYEDTFVRIAGDKNVYGSGRNLRGDLGLWGADAKPSAKTFLKTALYGFDKATVKKLSLKYPDHALAFELSSAKPEAVKTEADQGDGKKDDAKKVDAAPQPEQWKLVSGGPGGECKTEAVGEIVDAFCGMAADDVADPAKRSEYGLDAPGFECVATTADGKEYRLSGGGNFDGGKPFHAVTGDGLVYEIGAWRFGRVFRKGSALFELAAPRPEAEKVLALAVHAGGLDYRLIRKDANANWELERPALGFPLNQEKAAGILKKLGEWQPVDYADKAGLVAYGLQMPEATLEFEAGGTKCRYLLGKKQTSRDAWYFSAAEGQVLVMDDPDVTEAFPKLETLVEFGALSGVKQEEVAGIKATRGGKELFAVTRKEKDWELSAGGKAVPADATKLARFVDAVCGMRAEGVVGEEAADKALEQGVSYEIAGKTAVTLQAAPSGENGGVARREGFAGSYRIGKATCEGLRAGPEEFAPEPAVVPAPVPAPDSGKDNIGVDEGDAAMAKKAPVAKSDEAGNPVK